MGEPIYLVQGDTGPQIKATLTRDDTGSAQDITGHTIQMHFRKKFTDTVLFSLNGTITNDNAPNGIVIFNFSGTQLNIDAGEYEGEIEVTSGGGTVETVYEVIDFALRKDFA